MKAFPVRLTRNEVILIKKLLAAYKPMTPDEVETKADLIEGLPNWGPPKFKTAGGFTVETVHTNRGQWYRVVRPNGTLVPLNEFDHVHMGIRTFEQLTEVLVSEGEDVATLTEAESG